MSTADLEKMSLADLKALHKDIEKAIKTFEARKMAEARAALEAKARELGVTLEAVMGVKPARAVSSAAAKYRHPENPSLTWSGRGRTPKWIADHEAKGGNREDYAIA
jgi:DNA-binding protein H-NS